MPRLAYVPNGAVSMAGGGTDDQTRSCSGGRDPNRTFWCVVLAGGLMIWMLPVPVLGVTVGALAIQLRATRLFGDFSCCHRRINHSLSKHPAAPHH